MARANPNNRVVMRDQAQDAVPHLDAERFLAFVAEPEARTSQQQAAVAYSDGLIEEIRQAQVIVLGLPMYNFGIPSTLKAYFDHIAPRWDHIPLHGKGSGGIADRQAGLRLCDSGRTSRRHCAGHPTRAGFRTERLSTVKGFKAVSIERGVEIEDPKIKSSYVAMYENPSHIR